MYAQSLQYVEKILTIPVPCIFPILIWNLSYFIFHAPQHTIYLSSLPYFSANKWEILSFFHPKGNYFKFPITIFTFLK